MLAEGESDFSKTIAYYELAYNLAEMEEDLDTTVLPLGQNLVYSSFHNLQNIPIVRKVKYIYE